MAVKIMFFGKLADIAGTKEMNLPDQYNVSALRSTLVDLYPQLSGLSFAVAVNRKTVTDQALLSAGDEIALLPPFSGG